MIMCSPIPYQGVEPVLAFTEVVEPEPEIVVESLWIGVVENE